MYYLLCSAPQFLCFTCLFVLLMYSILVLEIQKENSTWTLNLRDNSTCTRNQVVILYLYSESSCDTLLVLGRQKHVYTCTCTRFCFEYSLTLLELKKSTWAQLWLFLMITVTISVSGLVMLNSKYYQDSQRMELDLTSDLSVLGTFVG